MAGTALERFGGADALRKYGNALAGVTITVGADSDGKPILKLSEDGEWAFGADDTPVSDKDEWAVNPVSFQHGYIAFEPRGNAIAYTLDGDIAERLCSVAQPLPYQDDLPELEARKARKGERGPEWKLQLTVAMVCISGPNKGAEVIYKPTSRGGLRVLRKLSEEIARRIADGGEDIVPLIELFSDSYYHKGYNKDIATPELEIVGWATLDATEVAAPARAKEPAKVEGKTRKTSALKKKEAELAEPKEDRRTARGRGRDDEPEEEETRPARGRTRQDDEPEEADVAPARGSRRRETRGIEDEKVAGNRRGARDLDKAEPDEDRRERRGRGRDEDTAEPAEDRRERGARGRSNGASDDKQAREPEDDLDNRRERRSSRRDEPEDERSAGVRGRNAAAGGRTRGDDRGEDRRSRR